jgi:ribosomal protein L37AE/L43A
MEKNDEPKYPYELFGVECDKGWEKLYQPIIDYISEYNKNNDDKIEIHQIKEKFGGLRIYLSRYTDELRQMIDDAEEESYNTCEICGKYIKKPIVEHHWVYPMCRKCFRKGEEKKEETLKQFENKPKKMNESFENSKDKSQEGSET